MKASFLLIVFNLTISSLQAKSLSNHNFSLDKKWLNLYRYQKKGKGFISLATNKAWFFSKEGQTSPIKEAKSAIKSFKENPRNYCRFPARARHLSKLGLIEEKNLACKQLELMRERLSLNSVSLVLASSYINNPSSAFGHTFFKLVGKNQSSEYSNWGFNFSAIQTTNNPLLYALYGLSGVFEGKFSILPYFLKLKEYRDNENRDLWEYKLNLSDNQLNEFFEHLWEINQAKFSYYYLSQNCSFHLLAFLDAINPAWSLQRRQAHFTIPTETLKVLSKTPDLVKEVRFHPSPYKRLMSVIDKANQETETQVRTYIAGSQVSPSKLNTQALDILIDLKDYSLSQESTSKKKKEKRELLIERSKRQSPPRLRTIMKRPTPPHKSQNPAYILVGYQNDLFDRKLMRLNLRASLHEYLDQKRGRNPWSKLVFGAASLSYEEKKQDLRLDKFTLVNVEANQKNLFSKWSTSWGMNLAIKDRQLTRQYDLSPQVGLSYGTNYQAKNFLFRIMIPFAIEYGRKAQELEKQRNLSIEGNLQVQLIGHIGSSLSYQLSTGIFHNTLLKTQLREFYSLRTRLHLFETLSLDINALYKLKRRDYGLSLIKYF